MSLATVQVFIDAEQALGAGLPNGTVKVKLTRADIDGAVVVPTLLEAALAADGTVTVPRWPNARGTQGSQYDVWFFDSAGDRVGVKLQATIPATNCNLHDVLNLTAPPALSDAEAAQIAAQGYAAAASNSASAAATSAATATAVLADAANVDAVAGDLPNINTVATSIADVNSAATNMAAIQAAPTNASAASNSATLAAASLAASQSLFNRIYLGGY
jgi:hypothetical protein